MRAFFQAAAIFLALGVSPTAYGQLMPPPKQPVAQPADAAPKTEEAAQSDKNGKDAKSGDKAKKAAQTDKKADKQSGDAKAKRNAAKNSAKASEKIELIDLNSASEASLDALPGIGKIRAAAIIQGRPYKAKDELVEKKILPQNVYDAIKSKIIARQK